MYYKSRFSVLIDKDIKTKNQKLKMLQKIKNDKIALNKIHKKNRKLTNNQVWQIRKYLLLGYSVKLISETFKVSVPTVYAINNRYTYFNDGFKLLKE